MRIPRKKAKTKMVTRNAVFPSQTPPPSPHLVTEICALRAAYPAGTRSGTILPGMPQNSRRVRWLSASNNQW
jgi:hypothetical protein